MPVEVSIILTTYLINHSWHDGLKGVKSIYIMDRILLVFFRRSVISGARHCVVGTLQGETEPAIMFDFF